jgi:hypothetical protein
MDLMSNHEMGILCFMGCLVSCVTDFSFVGTYLDSQEAV